MGYITISNVSGLSPTPSGITVMTVSYRLASDPDISGSYTIVTTNLQVAPDGTIIGGAFIIDNLVNNTSYYVKLTVNCSGFTIGQTVYVVEGGTTTTTTSTSSTSTSTTSTTTAPTTTTTSSTTTSTTTVFAVPQISWQYQELGGGSGSTGINQGPTGVENFQIFVTSSNSGTFSILAGNKVYIAVGSPSGPTPNYYYIRLKNMTDNIILYDFAAITPINYTSPPLQANKAYSILTITNLFVGTTSTTSTSSTSSTTTTSTTGLPTTTTSTTSTTTSTSTSTSSTTTTTTTLPPTTTTTTTTSTSTTTSTTSTSTSTTTTTSTVCPTIGGFTSDGTGTTTTTSTTTTSTSTAAPSTTTTSTSTVAGSTTTSTSTSTSSTTTTSTTAVDYNALVKYGTLNDGNTPTEAEILAGSFVIRDVTLPIALNWGSESAIPVFYWIAVPYLAPAAVKNSYFESTDNQGTMTSADDLFNVFTTVVVSGVTHLVWITNYATQFVNNDYIFQ